MGTVMGVVQVTVQNAAGLASLGSAAASVQLSRSIGAAVGLAVLGTILSQGMASAFPKYLPASAIKQFQASGSTAGAVFDPTILAHLPPAIAAGIRHGLADAMHPVFLVGLPIIAVALIATLLIREVPLRQTVHVTAGKQQADKAQAG
jgi:hypothetical protein